MKTRIVPIGNSKGIRIPKPLLDQITTAVLPQGRIAEPEEAL
jgi:antitoxin component of MazEF toxin-antitoxin module